MELKHEGFKMNYASVKKCDISNGPGFRVSLWVTGCLRKCKGCFNPEAQDEKFGKPFDDEAKQKIFRELEDPHCSGLSLLGGEPLSRCSDNRKQIIKLCKECKEKFPNKDIWCWTGYTFEEISSDPYMKDIVKYVDFIIDGPFIEEKKDLACPFRGSRNQRVIDVKKTLERKTIVEKRFDG
jgi:anaerobic ribonucleoside-triphosphate reductase activating protein